MTAEIAAATEASDTAGPSSPRRSRFGRFFWQDPNTQFLILAAVVGVLGAGGAIFFRWVTTHLTHLLTGADDIVAACESLPVLLRIFLPAAGGLVGGILASRLISETGP